MKRPSPSMGAQSTSSHAASNTAMAGHSKWSNIQYRKNRQDAAKSKTFTKIIREISVAARAGGGDPTMNPRLRLAMDKGIAANMSKDTIERAIKKATGELEGVIYEEIRYEGYGPGGVAIIVDCLSDNRTRTVAGVRHAFTKHGGNLGADGSVAFQFQHAGVISFASNRDEQRIFEVALEAGADDIDSSGGSIDVVTTPQNYEKVKNALETARLQFQHAAVTMRPQVAVSLSPEDAARCIHLLEALEDLDDVQNVYSNAEFPDDLAA